MEGFWIFLNLFQVYEAYKMAAPSSKVCKQVTNYNVKSWIQKTSLYFPRLLYRCIFIIVLFWKEIKQTSKETTEIM